MDRKKKEKKGEQQLFFSLGCLLILKQLKQYNIVFHKTNNSIILRYFNPETLEKEI